MKCTVSQRSLQLFEMGYYCAESVLLAVAENKGIQSDLLPRIATGFCSGVARTSGMCGAVSGAILAINLCTGRKHPSQTVDDNYARVRLLIESFEKKFGSTNCRQLIGCDLATTQGQNQFKTSHMIEKCKTFVEEAGKLAVSSLADIQEKPVFIRQSEPKDLDSVVRLLDALKLPTLGVQEHFKNFHVMFNGRKLVGAVGLEIYGNKALLRSLGIERDAQGKGYGKQLIQFILEKSAEIKIEELFLLTQTAKDFFSQFGFETVSRNRVDARIRSSVEFQSACPVSAICMRLKR